MSIAQQIIVRYRSSGHVRFALPAALCQPLPALHLKDELLQTAGVYRVDLYARQGKLSIRYHEDLADLDSVAKSLRTIVSSIENQPVATEPGLNGQESNTPVGGRLKQRYRRTVEGMTAMGLLPHNGPGPRPLLTPEKEKFVIDFFTDMLVLYLIKLHWQMILNNWIRRPWQYRYEWMATIYMIFLLVRSKKPK